MLCMRRKRRASCRECGTSTDDPASLSYRGLCGACTLTRAMEAAQQMRDKAGPYYDAWLAAGGQAGRKV